MDSRQQFEEWVVGRKVVKKHGAKLNTSSDGTYCDYRINDRWLAWQASRESLVVELPRGFSTDYCNGDTVFDAEEVMFSISKTGANG